MSSLSAPKTMQWQSFSNTIFLIIAALCLASIGFVLSQFLPETWLAFLAGCNIFVILGLLVARMLKPLAPLQFPLLMAASFLAGIVTSLLQNNFAIISIGLMLLCMNFILISFFAIQFKGEFQRFNLIIAVLAIIFSFVGTMLIFVQGVPLMTLIWASAAFICLDILLYTMFKKVFQTEAKDYFSAASPVVLLHIGLMVNALIALEMLSTLALF